ncbi:hypothetical protein BDP81DRAFT_450727 [Colletotrichum phormii]|uniref:Cyanovirin-N domain-containing protein n=1 Tax=Colletotrichum phormii TaxID=359342 RepID=A0AAI9ZPU7_9PEZI|nr:uncharacterized protein BDP81DRAFT_450727 [Colletotrichum phormii]KAK1635893.1 hypothetical protein BDP81DRAFT_450727 [Colletotrichum phormii]
MQLLTLSTLAVTLLWGQALADCGEGTFNGKPNAYNRVSNCNLNANNVYFCGNSGTSVVHKQSQLILRAGNVDSTVLVACNGFSFLYHCSAGETGRFREPQCKGAVWEVENIKEI